MQILVINLPDSTDRLKFQQEQLKRLGLDHEIIRAVSTNYVHEQVHYHLVLGWERPLLRSEVACYFSHHKIWQMVIKRNQPVLVLEDDALLSRHVPGILQALENRTDCDIVNLEVRGKNKTVGKAAQNLLGDYKLLPLFQDQQGAAGYVIWPSGAKQLLEKAKTVSPGPADEFIANTYELKKYQVEPAAVIQLDQCETYDVISSVKTTTTINAEDEQPSYVSFMAQIRFHKRRISSQFRAMMYQMSIRGESIRRPVALNPDDFL
ncbi:MAG: Glycosyl transferase, family 25 [uncultured Thiotrichaceae bacterium]|uniref:Glycosyl transferase, family 25 n=1 Tax=uncultured Thiotrichaceae bacterium TaxID=298394 RepID=A0A6S6TSW5_9GAMM|nr:MAG: Glycosyl transferase, family 25 [uncultured Thiotrichaceae bacterium]